MRNIREAPPNPRDIGGMEPLSLLIRTLEGEMKAQPGDWIIRGIAGEVYPCKPDIFEATYESAPQPEAASVAKTGKWPDDAKADVDRINQAVAKTRRWQQTSNDSPAWKGDRCPVCGGPVEEVSEGGEG